MIDFSTVLSGAILCLAGVMSPGPNFLAVSHKAVSARRADALSLVAGIALVNVLWSLLALFGVGLLASALPLATEALRYLGAAYLAWLGIRLLRSAHLATRRCDAPATASRSSHALLEGISTNLANPKSMLFYVSIFASAIPAHTSAPTRLALVLAVGVVALAWYGGLALMVSAPRISTWFEKHLATIERCCAFLLLGLSARQVIGS